MIGVIIIQKKTKDKLRNLTAETQLENEWYAWAFREI